MMQYYAEGGRIPPTILLPDISGEQGDSENDADDFDAGETFGMISDILSEKRGSKVRVYTPERGEMRELLKLADTNAREMMVRRILRGGSQGADPGAALRILERLWGREEGIATPDVWREEALMNVEKRALFC